MNNLIKIAAASLITTFACVAGAQGVSPNSPGLQSGPGQSARADAPGQQSGPGQSSKNVAPGQNNANKGAAGGNGQATQRRHGSDTTNKNMSGRNSFSGGKQGKGQKGANAN